MGCNMEYHADTEGNEMTLKTIGVILVVVATFVLTLDIASFIALQTGRNPSLGQLSSIGIDTKGTINTSDDERKPRIPQSIFFTIGEIIPLSLGVWVISKYETRLS